METKFTPGPWKTTVNKFTDDLYGVEVYQDSDKHDWVASIHSQFEGVENAKANAKLIAAAPEMLEVLNYVKNMMDCFSDNNWLSSDDLDLLKTINATIQKATTQS